MLRLKKKKENACLLRMITSHYVSCKIKNQKLCPGMLLCALKPFADKLQSNELEGIWGLL